MSRQKKITWTPARQKAFKNEITAKTIAITLACLMDEYDFNKEQLTAFSERFVRYSTAVEEHLITIKTVLNIIEDTTGIHIEW